MQQSDRRDRPGREVVEIRLRQLEGGGQRLEHVLRERQHRGVIIVRDPLEVIHVGHGLPGRPDVRPAVQLLLHDVGMVRGQLVADVDALFEFRVGALLEDLRAQELVAAVVGVGVLTKSHLFRDGQGESLFRHFQELGLKVGGDGVVGDLEETIVQAAIADLRDEILSGHGVVGVKWGEV